jgi:hypothetical protein
VSKALAEKKSKNPVGRPRKFKTPEEFKSKFEEYQKQLAIKSDGQDLFPTITDFCLFAEISRDTFYSMAKLPEFSDTIKIMHLFFERELEKRLYQEKGSPIKFIFGLKNLGWSDSGKSALDSGHSRRLGHVTIITTNTPPKISEIDINNEYEILESDES